MQPTRESERKFYLQLEAKTNNILLYEDIELQNLALECIPIEELSAKAAKKRALLATKDCSKIGEEDLLILELLNWFKSSFFSWVDIPKCENCDLYPERNGMAQPTTADQHWGASMVENYTCKACQTNFRFPRYNHPKKLLETRKGRCGEWANCFTLLCRSLGFDARLVIEWDDHVWTEVYSFTQKRWLHCDPCENCCDTPLIYELGWKKKIAYVIAFSKDEVQDVTWRYSINHKDVVRRRTLCRETWLLNCIMSFTKSLQSGLSNERKEELLFRKISELSEFLVPQQVKQNEFSGRSSGSLAWREARGECTPIIDKKSHVFQLRANEIKCKTFHIKYSCAADKYVRVSDNFLETDKWELLTFDESNVFRKIERDWNTVYLARKEGCTDGYVTWKFDFHESGLIIDAVKLYCSSKIFENGEVQWIVNSGTLTIPVKDIHPVTVRDLQGSSEFSLTAKLVGGHGPVAWQHAQLFRQPLNCMEFPFEIKISFV